MNNLPELQIVSNDCEFKADFSDPLIPEKVYGLSFVNYSTVKMFGDGKLILKFKVVEHGEYFGVELSRYYNVNLVGKPGRNGKFSPPKHGNFLIEYCQLFPDKVTKRLNRLSMSPFNQSYFRGEVRTVKRNNQQKKLPQPMQYSVISKLVRTA